MKNFDFSRFFKVLFNSKLYIIFLLFLFFVVGYFYSFYYVTPMYKSSATVVLVQNERFDAEDNSGSITQTDLTLNQNLLSTYTRIAKSNKVLEQVIENLGLNISVQSLSKLVFVQTVNNTEVVKISVSNENPILAANITNELLEAFSNEVQSLYNMNNVYIMDRAEPSSVPYNINHVKDLAVFGVMGGLASLGLVVTIYLFDTTIKSERDVEDYAGLSVLSTIPVYQDKKDKNAHELIVNEQPKSPISECFKAFRTNVMFSIQNKKLNTILVTSGFMSEGKSFVSSNLAVTFAQSGKRVILVDTDMRKGRIHKIFNLSHHNGLSNCLSAIESLGSLVNINDYIQKSNIPNLHIMTIGDVPPNPSELLSSSNMKKFLEALNSQYDVVICDGTPCMLVADSIILSKIVDTTVIVTANRSTKLDTLLKIKKSIEIVGGNIGGVVINKMTMNSKSYQNKYYYGNHNEICQDDFSNKVVDFPLNGMLCIHDTFEKTESFKDKQVDLPLKSEDLNWEHLSFMMEHNLEEIAHLKNLYKDVMNSTLDTILKKDNQASVMNELSTIKELYQTSLSKEQEELHSLHDKISNFVVEDHSDVLLDELKVMKSSYEEMFQSQNEYIATLDDKISNFAVEDHSDVLLDELKSMKSSYEEMLQSQNEYIASAVLLQNNHILALDNQFSNFEEKKNDVLLKEFSNIYKQLDNMNARFDVLEETARNNERLIRNMNRISSKAPVVNKSFDVRKLNDKVIMIQDYLENQYNPIVDTNVQEENSVVVKNKNVLDGQMNLLDNLLKNTEKTDYVSEIVEKSKDVVNSNIMSSKKDFSIDYERIQNRQKRGFSIFKSKVEEPANEEPIQIVSQILSSNHIENVG